MWAVVIDEAENLIEIYNFYRLYNITIENKFEFKKKKNLDCTY